VRMEKREGEEKGREGEEAKIDQKRKGGKIGERGEEEKVNTMAPEPMGGQFNNKHFEREEVNVMVDAHLEKGQVLQGLGLTIRDRK
jgi:hypothetical protein